VRGQALNDLYASVPVIVGDSCLYKSTGRYVSDRIPETLGRGGFLIHPHVDGVTDGALWRAGEHLVCWDVGDWAGLRARIDESLANVALRERIRIQGQDHTRAHHTYSHRVNEVLEVIGMQ
jgi:hypothetical protein